MSKQAQFILVFLVAVIAAVIVVKTGTDYLDKSNADLRRMEQNLKNSGDLDRDGLPNKKPKFSDKREF